MQAGYPPPERSAYANHLWAPQIAEMVGVPIGTVMSRLHRGRKFLQQRLLDVARERGIAALRTSGPRPD